ncbi:hypothetical protein GCM10009679_65520 [Saccharothrix algeriensis]|uniref:Uncharacterized protein n=1 Tax=Catellatospora bangladeshensis TaxID=310355 RepID=A0A8J3NN35_9ACTN|nr:hypothetical protein Cba03nite_72350 [Catellatospora bangladeshensis]
MWSARCGGYVGIQGKPRKLGHRVSGTMIQWLLRIRRLPPAPQRLQVTCRDFLRTQAGTILTCDLLQRQSYTSAT